MLFRKMAATELDWVIMIASLLVTEHVPGTSRCGCGTSAALDSMARVPGYVQGRFGAVCAVPDVGMYGT
jgi:hypothetical protein